MAASAQESVLCIPTAHFEAVGSFFGYRILTPAAIQQYLEPTQFTFRPRAAVETDPSFKQLIPYVTLHFGDSVFCYQRGTTGTEKRLTAKKSLGIGGHIDQSDAENSTDPYLTGMWREVREEVTIPAPVAEESLGLIYDDRTEVGSVHLGIVHRFRLGEPSVTTREDKLIALGFLPMTDLIHQRDEFETWSQFLMDSWGETSSR